MDWKSKINMVILVFLIGIIATASALTIGQIITRQQFEETNIQTTDLEPVVESKEKTDSQIRVWFSYFSLEENGEDYEVIRKTSAAIFKFRKYNDCRALGGTKAQCVTQGKAELISQAKSIIRNEKTELKELQIIDYTHEITANDFDIKNADLDISDKELN